MPQTWRCAPLLLPAAATAGAGVPQGTSTPAPTRQPSKVSADGWLPLQGVVGHCCTVQLTWWLAWELASGPLSELLGAVPGKDAT